MAIRAHGKDGVEGDVDGTTYNAMRFTARPLNNGPGGHFSLTLVSSTMAAALGASNHIYQFRYLSQNSRVAVIHYVGISAGVNVAATAAALMRFRMAPVRRWTAPGTGGTRMTFGGENMKLRTYPSGTPEVNDIGIATTGPLGFGTYVEETTDIGAVAFGIGTAVITSATSLMLVPKTPLFDSRQEGCSPFICEHEEGFIIRIGNNAMPATMTWTFSVETRWSEVFAL